MEQPLPTVQSRYRKRRPQEQPARGLVILWCVWVIVNWLIGTRLDHYIHATRWLMFACMFGLMIMWPAIRLCQDMDRRLAVSQVLWDWFSLNLAFQVAIWPMKVSAQWSVTQTLWIDAAMAAWSLLTGVILAAAMRRNSGGVRAAAMAGCVLLVFGEPVLAATVSMAGPGWQWPILFSPVETLTFLTASPPRVAPAQIVGIAFLAFAGWLAIAAALRQPD